MTDRRLNEYLDASGATALCIVKQSRGYAIKTGRHAARDLPDECVFWLAKDAAIAVARGARKAAGEATNFNDACLAVHSSAARAKTALSTHPVVQQRARHLALQLDAYIDALRASGKLQAFNSTYQRKRTEALARGEGFMTYPVALAKLRRALVPYLKAGRRALETSGMLAEVFGVDECSTAEAGLRAVQKDV